MVSAFKQSKVKTADPKSMFFLKFASRSSFKLFNSAFLGSANEWGSGLFKIERM